MANPDWTDPLDFSADDLLVRVDQLERLGNMLVEALQAAETFVAKSSGNGEVDFRATMQSVIHDARQVLA